MLLSSHRSVLSLKLDLKPIIALPPLLLEGVPVEDRKKDETISRAFLIDFEKHANTVF
jgi:hypothetical protein